MPQSGWELLDAQAARESSLGADGPGIAIKLSQGAKPGKGGIRPTHKATEEIARICGVRAGEDRICPNNHRAYSDNAGLIRFVEDIAATTGLPVGIKSAVGHTGFWKNLARAMEASGRGPDWITIDGGEGGAGAPRLVFTDHV